VSPRIERLKDAVQVMHRCKAAHVASAPVIEMFRDQVAWDGVVEVFDITGHPKAKRCYAWSYQGDKEEQFTTVLEIPPVVSPNTAVRASIVAESKSQR
jgi:hypothetical protein